MSSLNSYLRLDKEVNRIIYVKNLPFKISNEELYELFGKYGALRQIRVGNNIRTKGAAFIIFEDIFDAKTCYDTLNGFNLNGKYLIMNYFNENIKK